MVQVECFLSLSYSRRPYTKHERRNQGGIFLISHFTMNQVMINQEVTADQNQTAFIYGCDGRCDLEIIKSNSHCLDYFIYLLHSYNMEDRWFLLENV